MPLPPSLRLSFGLLSVLPVGFVEADRRTFGAAMAWAPLVGAVLGGCQALAFVLLERAGAGALLAAVLAVGLGAVLTRALHLDGLADVADGLGSGRPAAEALAVMKRSDIGPFGVVTLVFTLLAQVAAVASAGHPAAALVLAGATGRLALVWACSPGVPAARPDGLGALVAGTVPARVPAAWTGALLLAAAGTAAWRAGPAAESLVLAAAVPVALGAAALLRRHLVRRFGGVTGDVLGALAELAGTVVLVVATLG
ncbi:adenosylcobinamide-GDP ribazoletransferase [Actinocorallia populi]|uniref:adenosylcobinamide-GDP ribazoletransferase n=1 Tax=Actinocorallia populi TaxID=2079200 RepID=UPI001E5B9F02|nr:adenosylcobinamide-GDP ribazoletransferase [Actinocorallia populi]